MQKINDPSQVEDVTIRSFFQQRFEQLEGDISDTEFILVESGDSLESLESGTGCALFSCWCSEAVYGDEDYQPSFEFIEQKTIGDRPRLILPITRKADSR